MSAEATRVGQRVVIDATKHSVPLDLLNQPVEVVTEEGVGDDAFVTVRGPKGIVMDFGRPALYRATELLPAPAILKPGKAPRIASSDAEETVHMTATQNLISLANELGGRREHYIEASRRLPGDAKAYRESFGSPAPEGELDSPQQSTEADGVARLRTEADRKMREEGLSAEAAVDAVLRERVPDAGASRFTLRVRQLKATGLDDLAALLAAQREDPAGAESYRLSGR